MHSDIEAEGIPYDKAAAEVIKICWHRSERLAAQLQIPGQRSQFGRCLMTLKRYTYSMFETKG